MVCAVIDTDVVDPADLPRRPRPRAPRRRRRPDFIPLDGDPLLGFRASERTERVVELAVGDTLALYSDGLVETRHLSLDHGLTELQRQAADVLTADLADDRASELASRLVGERHHDDVTILLVGRRDPRT